jgi:hypothetical protein
LKQLNPNMTILVRFSLGRILLRVLAMLADHSVRFHWEGIARELPCVRSTRAVLERARDVRIRFGALPVNQPRHTPSGLAALSE